jgi:hypothetical protein
MSAPSNGNVPSNRPPTVLIDNNLAGGLTVAAGLVAFVSPPHGIALGIGSGLFWLCANYRQSIANDPPREAFDEV